MNRLPQQWIETTLDQIAQWGSGGTPSRRDPANFGGTIPWIKTGELGQRFVTASEENISERGLSSSSAKIFPPGSVAIAMYGATIGKTSILGIEAATNQACAVAIPDVSITTTEYLYHYLCSQRDAFVDAGKGGAQPNISQSVLKAWPVPLPPLPEQKRIADKLDRLLARVDACRERLDRVPALLKRFRQSVLAAATSGELTREWRGGSDAAWTESRIHEICRNDRYALAIGPFGSNLKVSDYRNNGVPLVFVREIRARTFGAAGTKFVSPEKAAELRAHAVQPGDLLITKMGDPPGDTAIYPVDRPPAIMTADVVCMRVDPSIADPRFISYVIESPLGRERILEITAGVAQQKISLERFRTMLLPLPSLDEQQEIARRVSELFDLADQMEQTLRVGDQLVDQITPATLAKAFRGELVPQDPTDEPAAALLAHIHAAREEAGASAGTRRRKARSAD